MSNSYKITIVKDVYQFSQSIARQRIKTNYSCHNGNMVNLTVKNNYLQFEGQAEWYGQWRCTYEKLCRQAEVKKPHQHQASSGAGAERTSPGRKHKPTVFPSELRFHRERCGLRIVDHWGFLAAQWLGLCAFTAGPRFDPWLVTEIL